MKKLLIISNNQDIKKQINHHLKDFEIVENNPDIVIVDEDEEKAAKYKNIPTIFISENNIVEGAANIKKPFMLGDLFATLSSCQNVFENSEGYSLQWNSFELFINKKELVYNANKESYKLTEKEVDLLKYFYKYKDKFISKKELLENVWGYNPEISTHTTETHIYRLRQKVEPTSEVIIETFNGEYKLKA